MLSKNVAESKKLLAAKDARSAAEAAGSEELCADEAALEAVGDWADDAEVRKLVGADGSVDGHEDKVLGWFHVGVTEKYENYKGRRAPIAEKLTWID